MKVKRSMVRSRKLLPMLTGGVFLCIIAGLYYFWREPVTVFRLPVVRDDRTIIVVELPDGTPSWLPLVREIVDLKPFYLFPDKTRYHAQFPNIAPVFSLVRTRGAKYTIRKPDVSGWSLEFQVDSVAYMDLPGLSNIKRRRKEIWRSRPFTNAFDRLERDSTDFLSREMIDRFKESNEPTKGKLE